MLNLFTKNDTNWLFSNTLIFFIILQQTNKLKWEKRNKKKTHEYNIFYKIFSKKVFYKIVLLI